MRNAVAIFLLVSAISSASPAVATVPSLTVPAPEVSLSEIRINRQTFELLQERNLIRSRLRAKGLSDSEITVRLLHLSDEQTHRLASFVRSKNTNNILLESLRKSNP